MWANDSDLNFRISVNVLLSTPGTSGLLFLPVPCPFLQALKSHKPAQKCLIL